MTTETDVVRLNVEELHLDIDEKLWQPMGNAPDVWARVIGPRVYIGDVLHHLEAWAVVTGLGGIQRGCQDDERFGMLHQAVGAEGHFETVTINGRDYAVVMSPAC